MREHLPNFLIIGAMKSGTTTLYNDLKVQPQVFLPNRKEPHDLLYPAVLTKRGRRRYMRLFKNCPDGHISGEASTHYTARPFYEGTAERARQLLGGNTKIVYLVRNPVDRTISHFQHAYAKGAAELPMLHAFQADCRFLSISQYAMQIDPWVEQFGWQNIRIIQFEHYVADRQQSLMDLGRFLGFDAAPRLLDLEKKFNEGEGNRLWPKSMEAFINSNLCRILLDPILSPRLRETARRILAPRPRPRPAPPEAGVIDYVIDAVKEDSKRFSELISIPFWDWDATRDRYTSLRNRSENRVKG